MAEEDFISFEKALSELQLSAEQLKRLVSEGEIRAIRGDKNSMKFKKEEIDRLKQDTGKTIQFTEASSETLTDDLLFDESDDVKLDEEGTATVQLSGKDTFVAPNKGGAKGASAPKAAAKPAPQSARTTAQPKAAATGTAKRSTTSSTRRGTAAPVGAAGEGSGIGIGMAISLMLTTLVLAFAWFVISDAGHDQVTGLTRGIADFCVEKFAK